MCVWRARSGREGTRTGVKIGVVLGKLAVCGLEFDFVGVSAGVEDAVDEQRVTWTVDDPVLGDGVEAEWQGRDFRAKAAQGGKGGEEFESFEEFPACFRSGSFAELRSDPVLEGSEVPGGWA